MARHVSVGAALLVILAAACGTSETTSPDPVQDAPGGKPEPGPSLVLGNSGSTIQIRQVFGAPNSGTAGNVATGPGWLSALSTGDKYWDRNNFVLFNNAGDYQFEDYMLIVPAGRKAMVELWGGQCKGESSSGPKLYDPYLYIFDWDTKAFIERDDDDGCGYNSSIVVDNSASSAARRYVVRATEYSASYRGTYRLVITFWRADQNPTPNPNPPY